MATATRSFSKRFVSLIVLAGAAACLMATNGDAASSSRCAPSGSSTLAQTASVRVYRIGSTRVYGCLFSSGKARRLDRGSNSPVQRSTVRINGRFVGFARGKADARPDDLSVNVVDLKAGDSVHSADPGGAGGIVLITDLEVAKNGSVAWIANVESDSQARRNEVLSADSTGEHKLDASSDAGAVARDSLAVSGNRVYWMKGSTPMSAALR